MVLWLKDLLIDEGYIPYFNDVGFRELADFLHLNSFECEEMFEFLKVGYFLVVVGDCLYYWHF